MQSQIAELSSQGRGAWPKSEFRMCKEKPESREIPNVSICKKEALSSKKEQGEEGVGGFENAVSERPQG